jgi:hypothetical protein
MTNEERFWSKVDKTPSGCWVWLSTKNTQGYGRFAIRVGPYKQRWYSAHRLVWEWVHGSEPELCVLHRCDNPSCVNPGHLFLGTHKDNAADRDAKRRRRAPKGVLNGMAKLTEADVREIRRRFVPGVTSVRALAEKYGVSQPHMSGVVYGRHWPHVEGALCPKPTLSCSGAEI